MRSSLGRAEPIRALKVQNKGADGPRTGSYGAMAARWIPDPKVGGSNPSSFTPFFAHFFAIDNSNKKKCTAEIGNYTQAAAATTRSPATRLFRRNCIWRIRVSVPALNLAKVVCYHVQQSPTPTASIGTRTRILSLEGINTTLVLWTLESCERSASSV